MVKTGRFLKMKLDGPKRFERPYSDDSVMTCSWFEIEAKILELRPVRILIRRKRHCYRKHSTNKDLGHCHRNFSENFVFSLFRKSNNFQIFQFFLSNDNLDIMNQNAITNRHQFIDLFIYFLWKYRFESNCLSCESTFNISFFIIWPLWPCTSEFQDRLLSQTASCYS